MSCEQDDLSEVNGSRLSGILSTCDEPSVRLGHLLLLDLSQDPLACFRQACEAKGCVGGLCFHATKMSVAGDRKNAIP